MKVYPLLTGEFEANEATKMRGGDPKKTVWFSSYVFYVDDADIPTVIDTSFAEPEFCRTKLNHPSKRGPGMSVEERLETHGVTTRDIKRLVLTHCHWDHIGGLQQFTNATIYCQRDEVSWSLAPPRWLSAAYPSALSDSLPSVRDRLILVDGDSLISEGIYVRKVGAHSPGSQMIEIQTNSGTVIITGDAILYYVNFEQKIPIGTYHDLHEAMNVIQYLWNRSIQENVVILPSHDPEVWKRYEQGV